MGYIINAIKAFVSKEPNEFNEGNLSVAEKKEFKGLFDRLIMVRDFDTKTN